MDADRIAEMLADRVGDLLGRDEKIGGAVGIDDRIGQRDRRVGDVLPRTLNAQAIESSAESTTASALRSASQSAISARLAAEDLPASRVVLDRQRGVRRGGLVGPDQVDRIGVDRDQFGALSASALRASSTQARVCSQGS
jgi:hypothetical protein